MTAWTPERHGDTCLVRLVDAGAGDKLGGLATQLADLPRLRATA
ncbi:hypothetical protein [Frankia sp. AiPa1]|nr:hypothetical protein [Frankia sp. AiPa1]